MTEPIHVLDVIRASRPKVVPVLISTGTVFIRTMSGEERHIIVTHNYKFPEQPMSDAAVAAIGLCDQDGRKLFARPEEGMGELNQMHAGDLQTIAVRLLRLSGMRVAGLFDADEAALKNSEASQNSSPGTGSQPS